MNPPTAQEARKSAQRLINSHFGNPDQARMSIPTRPDKDDDCIIMAYINHAEKRIEELEKQALMHGEAGWTHTETSVIAAMREGVEPEPEWTHYKRQNRDPEDVWIRRVDKDNNVECWYRDADGKEKWSREVCSSGEIHEMRSESGRWKRFTPEEGGES